MSAQAYIVHQTRGRVRLRIPEKRKQLPFFLDLYADLQKTPAVKEVTMNPATGSVLLRFDEHKDRALMSALADCDLIELAGNACSGLPVQQSAGQEKGRIARFLEKRGSSASDSRTIVFIIVLIFSIQQVRNGQFFGPVLTMLLYGADLAVGLRKDTEPVEVPEPS